MNGALIYRPPRPRANFCDQLIEQIAMYVLASNQFLLLGDFNFHGEEYTNLEVNKLLLNLELLGLTQRVKGPTHLAGHSLDLIFSTLTN